ncbi:MAG: nucleoside deaminase [Phycisphaerales bacterium]
MIALLDAARIGIEAAVAQARKSEREGGIPIGSCLLDADGVVVALGHNMRVQADDPTAHAETVCIRNAGRRRDWHTLTLVSTLSPCAMCTGTSILHRIPRVVIGERQNFQGREDWFAAEKVTVEIVNDPRCVEMMARFIKERPELWWEDIGVPEGGDSLQVNVTRGRNSKV